MIGEDILSSHVQRTSVLFQHVNPIIPNDRYNIFEYHRSPTNQSCFPTNSENSVSGIKRKLKASTYEIDNSSLKIFKKGTPSMCQFEQLSIRMAFHTDLKKEAPKLLIGYQSTPLLENNVDTISGPAPSDAAPTSSDQSLAVTTYNNTNNKNNSSESYKESTALIVPKKEKSVPKPQWHAPWELDAVISGHLGWVRSIAFDPSNEWFVTGSADRTIKVWDLAKCCAGAEDGLKLTLTGHINAVRGLVVSPRHPYLFSAGEDNMVKCWDLEYNKVIRHYHGHLSGVFALGLHPTLDVLISAGRDAVGRVWDIRSRNQIHCLSGHENTIGSLLTNAVDPQIITGSYDNTIKLWDLAAGKCMSTLTHHKKAIRSLVANKRTFTFCSGAADNIKKWKTRDGMFLQNLSGHNTPMNALALNEDNVLVSGGDNGSLCFWDYETGYCFQKSATIVQPGSLDAESGIYASAFDLSGSRLLTCEADKSIKIWKENELATEETHPIDMTSWSKQYLALKRF